MFVLTIGPVERFRRSKQVVSYLGLNPREDSSGGRQRLGSISKQGNRMLRGLLREAAQTASQFDPELRRHYRRLKFRRGSGVAEVHRPQVGGAAILETAKPFRPCRRLACRAAREFPWWT